MANCRFCKNEAGEGGLCGRHRGIAAILDIWIETVQKRREILLPNDIKFLHNHLEGCKPAEMAKHFPKDFDLGEFVPTDRLISLDEIRMAFLLIRGYVRLDGLARKLSRPLEAVQDTCRKKKIHLVKSFRGTLFIKNVPDLDKIFQAAENLGLTLVAAAQRLGVLPVTLYSWARKFGIPYRRSNGRKYFQLEDLIRFAQSAVSGTLPGRLAPKSIEILRQFLKRKGQPPSEI